MRIENEGLLESRTIVRLLPFAKPAKEVAGTAWTMGDAKNGQRLEFGEDGTFKATIPSPTGGKSMVKTGTWKAEGDVFTATAEVVALVGATPVFADVGEPTFNLDARSLQRACAMARRLGLRPKAVIPVDLFGQPADHKRIAAWRVDEGLRLTRSRDADVALDSSES